MLRAAHKRWHYLEPVYSLPGIVDVGKTVEAGGRVWSCWSREQRHEEVPRERGEVASEEMQLAGKGRKALTIVLSDAGIFPFRRLEPISQIAQLPRPLGHATRISRLRAV